MLLWVINSGRQGNANSRNQKNHNSHQPTSSTGQEDESSNANDSSTEEQEPYQDHPEPPSYAEAIEYSSSNSPDIHERQNDTSPSIFKDSSILILRLIMKRLMNNVN